MRFQGALEQKPWHTWESMGTWAFVDWNKATFVIPPRNGEGPREPFRASGNWREFIRLARFEHEERDRIADHIIAQADERAGRPRWQNQDLLVDVLRELAEDIRKGVGL